MSELRSPRTWIRYALIGISILFGLVVFVIGHEIFVDITDSVYIWYGEYAGSISSPSTNASGPAPGGSDLVLSLIRWTLEVIYLGLVVGIYLGARYGLKRIFDIRLWPRRE